jgi:hypothetical protein
MAPGEAFVPSIAIAILLVIMLWFAFGTQRNIRRGNDLLRWLQDGLPLLGQRATLRWLGSTAAELTIVSARPPFRDAQVVVVLEPRDIPLLWLFSRTRGRRDFVIVRGNLLGPPRFVLEAADPAAWGRAFAATDAAEGETAVEWTAGITARASAGADVAVARQAWDRLAAVTDGVWRMTIQPVVPHLEVHFRPARSAVSSDRPISAIADLGRAVGSRPASG